MPRFLLSRVARNNDFTKVDKGPERPNPLGPTIKFHQHFWEAGGYDHHVLFYSKADQERLAAGLRHALNELPGKRRVETVLLPLNDVVDLEEVKTLLHQPARFCLLQAGWSYGNFQQRLYCQRRL